MLSLSHKLFGFAFSTLSLMAVSSAHATDRASENQRLLQALQSIDTITVNGEAYLNKQQVLELLGQSQTHAVEEPSMQKRPQKQPLHKGIAEAEPEMTDNWSCSLKPPFADNFFEATAATRHQATNWVSGECMKALQDAVQCRESRVVCSED